MTKEDLKEAASKFKQLGAFSQRLSDFVIKVSSDVLKVPITVVLSCSKFAVQTVIPKELISCIPIIIACNTEYLHYSPTINQSDSQDEMEEDEKLDNAVKNKNASEEDEEVERSASSNNEKKKVVSSKFYYLNICSSSIKTFKFNT